MFLCRANHATESHDRPYLFRRIGKLFVAGDAFLVQINVNQKIIGEGLNQLKNELLEVNKVFNSLNRSLALHYIKGRKLDSGTHYGDFLSRTVNNQLQFLLDDIRQKQDKLSQYLISLGVSQYHGSTPNPSRKAKRGLINVAGSILSYTLGIATSEQLDKTRDRIQSLEDLYSSTNTEFQVFSEIIEVASNQIEEIAEQQQKLTKAIIEVNAHLNSLAARVSIQLEDISSFTMLLTLIVFLSSGFRDLELGLMQLKFSIDHLKLGGLDQDLITPDLLKSIFLEMKLKDMTPLLEIDLNHIHLFYELIEVVPTNQPLEYILKIPTKPKFDYSFDLYNLVHISTPVKKGQKLSIRGLKDYFMINHDLSAFFTSGDLKTCKQYRDLYVCTAEQPIYKNPKSYCEGQLFMQLDPTECIWEVKQNEYAEEYIWSPKGWLYAINDSTNLATKCIGQEPTFSKVTRGNGFLNFNNSCIISTDKAILPSVHAKGGRIRQVSPQVLTIKWSHINNIKFNLDNLSLGNGEPFDNMIENSEGMKLETLKLKMLTLKNRSSHEQYHKNMSISAIAITGINIFVLLIIITSGIYVYRIAKKRSLSKVRRKQLTKSGVITDQS